MSYCVSMYDPTTGHACKLPMSSLAAARLYFADLVSVCREAGDRSTFVYVGTSGGNTLDSYTPRAEG